MRARFLKSVGAKTSKRGGVHTVNEKEVKREKVAKVANGCWGGGKRHRGGRE